MEEMISLFGNDSAVSEEKSRAVLLHQEIIFNRDRAADHLYKMCRQLKEMRDTQAYKSLGFDSFDNYVEQAAEIKKRQAYNYIRIIERLGDDFVQSNTRLGVTKLEMLIDVLPEERAELIEENDLGEMSVKELKAEIDKLKEQTKQLSLFEEENESLKKELSKRIETDTSALERRIEELEEENRRLGEVPPAEVSEDELEKLRKEIAAEVRKKEKAKRAAEIEKAAEKAKKEAEKNLEAEKKAAADEAVRELKESLDEIEKEKAEAVARAEDFRKKLEISKNGDATTFKYLFEECQGRFNKMLDFLDGIKESDADTYNKLLAAVRALISQMEGALGNEN